MRGFLFGALCCLGATPALAEPVFTGDVRLFEVLQNGQERLIVPAVERAQSQAAFYDYRSASSHTGFEQRGRSLLFLYRDLRDDELSLVITSGIDNLGQPQAERQGSAQVTMDLDGVPAGTRVAVSDDGGEFTNPAPGRFQGRWRFGDNTDGGVIGGLPIDEDWEITISNVTFGQDMNEWQYYFADGSVADLDIEEDLILRSRGASQGPNQVEAPEGQEVLVCALATDDAFGAIELDMQFDWQDGTVDNGVTPAGQLFCMRHVYRDDGVFDVEITATNAAGESAQRTVTATISNVAPIGSPGGPYAGDEGQLIEFNGALVADPGLDDTHEVRWDFDGDGTFDTGFDADFGATFRYADDGVYQATMQIRDDDNGRHRSTVEVVIGNLPPEIVSDPPAEGQQGVEIVYDAEAEDPGEGDDLMWSLEDAPDGAEIDPMTGEVRWTPDADGVGETRFVVVVTDDDGAEDRQVVVIDVRPDTDGDGFIDPDDLCPITPDDQTDTDGDGFGDACDNCIDVPNPDQADADEDDLGDVCDDCAGEPRAEECNGADDDCDGLIDEQIAGDGEDACETGEPGVCAAGVSVCDGAGGQICQPVEEQQPEVCDGLDNDCDNAVDEDVVGQRVCATGQPGICAAGMGACLEGEQACTPDASPVDEICDGEDNDCDGTIDEALRNACGRCGPLAADVCDGRDQDCDGVIDEAPACPSDQLCVDGECRDPCNNLECAGDAVCVDGACVDRCDAVACDAGQVCVAGECVDPCAGVNCAAGEVCDGGDCVPDTCFERGCGDDEVCTDDGSCAPDPCAGVDCAPAEFCRNGACVPSCAAVSCALNERCVDGICVGAACIDGDCPDGEVCLDDACVADPCADVNCEAGQACVLGECVADPCAAIECPPGEACIVDAAGIAQCQLDYEGEGGAGGVGGDGGAGGVGGAGGDGGGTGGLGGDQPPPNDRDGDNLDDEEDNCPDDPNPMQLDNDDDGIGNACDPDFEDPIEPDSNTSVSEEGCTSAPGSNGAPVLILGLLGAALHRRQR